jgi:hypothetical protein
MNGYYPIQRFGCATMLPRRSSAAAALGAKHRRPVFGTFLAFAIALNTACGDSTTDPEPGPDPTGAIRVALELTGVDLDPDGCTTSIDGGTARHLQNAGAEVFSSLSVGNHEVLLAELADNCAVNGANPRTVSVIANQTAEMTFRVECSSRYPDFTAEMVTPVYVSDVVAAFHAIQDHGLYLEAHTTDAFDYRPPLANHVQGIQRLRQSNYIMATAKDADASKLALAHIASIPELDLLASNENPPAGDAVVRVEIIDIEMIHAGGISACGDIIVVPIEGDGRSEIRFFFVPQDDPESFWDLSTQFPDARVARGTSTAGAVSLTRLPAGPHEDHYLLAVLAHGSDGPLDFYLSNTRHVFDGFGTMPVSSWAIDAASFYEIQNIDLILQPDGEMYLLGTRCQGDLCWSTGGEDWGYLYKVEFADDSLLTGPTLTQVAGKHFYAYDHGGFEGAAGIYVSQDGKLALYTAEQYTEQMGWTGDKLRMTEFAWPQQPTEYWIRLYDDSNFSDRMLELYGTSRHFLPNYNHVYVDGEWGFNDKASAAAWKLPPGTIYVLYENNTYGGSYITLIGNGEIQLLNLNDVGFGDKLSSSKFFGGS